MFFFFFVMHYFVSILVLHLWLRFLGLSLGWKPDREKGSLPAWACTESKRANQSGHLDEPNKAWPGWCQTVLGLQGES